MQTISSVSLSHEYQFPDQSSIRRYYVETNSVSRKPGLDSTYQDNLDSLKFYVVARRNYSAVDFPFVVPKLFTQFTNNSGLFKSADEGTNDFFDRGVTSTDDSDILDDSPFPIYTTSPSDKRPLSTKRSKRANNLREDYDTSNFFDEPFEDSLNYENDINNIKSQSQERRLNISMIDKPRSNKSRSPLNKSIGRISDKNISNLIDKNLSSQKHLSGSESTSPLRLLKPHSRPVSIGEGDISYQEEAALELEDLKSSRGSQKSRADKQRRTPSTTNLLYKLDRKGAHLSKKGTFKDGKEGLKVTKKGPYKIVRGQGKLPLQKPGKKSISEDKLDKKQDLAIYKGTEVEDTGYDMGGFGDFDSINDVHSDGDRESVENRDRRVRDVGTNYTGVGPLGPLATGKRRPRPSVSSSALLNSWYITTRSESEDKNWTYEKEPQSSNTRYPRRFRRPPSQHWVSNMTSDGKSVLFMAGVSTQRLTTHHLTDERFPSSSLVLTNDHGDVKLEIVKQDSESDPQKKSLSDYVNKIAPNKFSTPRRLGLPSTSGEVVRAISDAPKKARRLRKAIGRPTSRVVKRAAAHSLSSSSSSKDDRRDYGSENGKMVKVTRDISVEESLKLLRNLPEKYDEGKTLSIVIEDDVYDPSDAEPRPKRVHSKSLKKMYDSFVEHGNERIYYKCVHKPEQNRIPFGALVFNTMVFTSQCRTSDVRIPGEKEVDFKDVQTNFIFGYVHAGADLVIEGDGVEEKISKGKMFFLPTHKKWKIKNNNKELEANIALSFINI